MARLPGEINVASAGLGTITHLSGELFRSTNQLNWTHVPYKGTAPALTDLAGGRAGDVFHAAAGIGHGEGQSRQAASVSGKARMSTLPDIPTVNEALNIDYNVDNWYGIFVPAGTPPDIVHRLADEVAQSVASSDVVSALGAQGVSPGAMSQQQFADYVRAEVLKWGGLVKATGAKAD
ncbi:MAG: hypothetical protein IPI03_19000 [Rubrivivax sp.]|nr:hypothetical protein [Rubrivivax sp.]